MKLIVFVVKTLLTVALVYAWDRFLGPRSNRLNDFLLIVPAATAAALVSSHLVEAIANRLIASHGTGRPN